jgi:hypothetical protein
MHLPPAVVDELARVWVRLHRDAAAAHLRHMIGRMHRSGDLSGIENYRRILRAVNVLSHGSHNHFGESARASQSTLAARGR